MQVKRKSIITMDVNVTSLQSAVNSILQLIGTGSYVCVSNVHMCMETFDSSDFRRIVNQADLVIPDGRPIYWAQKLLYAREAEHVRGQDIMNKLCQISGDKKINIGLYGGASPAVLRCVVKNLECKYPDIKIVYSYAPPFRSLTADEDLCIIRDISRANVDILFVGIGCPKQEKWMAEHKKSLACVMLGVGAAFDFIAGSKKHAPLWMQLYGLEWLYRLFTEPRRLWKRYLRQNPRFIWYFFLQLLGKNFVKL